MIVRQDPVKQAQLRLFHKPAGRGTLYVQPNAESACK